MKHAPITADPLAPSACLALTLAQVRNRILRESARRFEIGRMHPDRERAYRWRQAQMHRLGFTDAAGHRTQLARESCAQPGRLYGEALAWAYGIQTGAVRGQIGREIVEAAFGAGDELAPVVRCGTGWAA